MAVMSILEEEKDSRAARLAQALRENLRKRKNQARVRKEDASKATGADSSGSGRERGWDGSDHRHK